VVHIFATGISTVNPLKKKRILFYLKIHSYRAVNTFHLVCKNQAFYVTWGIVVACSEINKETHKYSLGRMYGFWLLNLLVHRGTSMLEKFKGRGSWQRKNRKERWDRISCGIHVYSLYVFFGARMYTCHSRVCMVYGICRMFGETDL
jgi:hypothetical protein